MRARLFGTALCTALLALGRATPALAATDSVLVRVGGQLAARQNETIEVPITVDLSGAPGRALGSYRATLRFNPVLLEFEGADNGGFALPQTNTNHAADSGAVLLTAVQPSGATGAVILFYVRFHVLSDTGQSPVTISFDEMSANATSVTPFESLLPLLRIVNGTFCRSLGRWGDANGDGDANSLDALVALSTVVGIPVDTTLMNPALTDVDGDGRVTSRDALIILSYAVGLPVTGYRILLDAPGACGTGSPMTLVIIPDSLELQVGQSAAVSFAALDSTGRSVSTDTGGTVTSSDPSIAGWVRTEAGQVVQARAPGVAIFTARLSPGLATTFKVVVLARRTKWYVDVRRASLAPAQLGDSALPFEFIGDAINLAHDGDTVLVAGGTYEEEVSGTVAVTLLGDSTNLPVLDPRGSPSWSSYNDALDLSPGGGQIVLANLLVRAGMTYLAAHDVTVRNVRIEGLGTNGYSALELSTVPGGDAPPARAAGPQRSSLPEAPGNVLVDGVEVLADSTQNGITVDLADTAVIRNSTVRKTQPGQYPTCGAGPYTAAGILVQQASVSMAQNDSVINPLCQGIALFDNNSATLVSDFSRVTATHNVVISAPGTGIALGARLVSSDHDVVSSTGMVPGVPSYGASIGIYAQYYEVPPDTVWSLGDSIVGSGGRGFVVDTVAKAVVDSLVVSGTGLDSSYGGTGVTFQAGGTYWLSHGRISNTVHSPGVVFTGEHTVLHSRGNHISASDLEGITVAPSCYSCAPPARSGPALGGAQGPPQRTGPYAGGPDTLTSVSDTIVNAGGNGGIYSQSGIFTLVDSSVVDSAYYGIYLAAVARGTVSHSVIRDSYYGIYASEVDTLGVLGDTLDANYEGVYVNTTVDSATIRGTVASANADAGFWIDNYTLARIDSSVALNNHTGLYISYGTSAALVRWARFQGNGIGMWMGNNSAGSSVFYSSFLGDTAAGARNDADGPLLVADTNYWGDARGPRCTFGCDPLSLGDSVIGSVTFLDSLASPPPTPSAPARIASAAARPARRPPPAREAFALAPRPPVPGRSAAPMRSPHRQAPAWHAPSKARTHALQIVVRKRT